MSRQNKTTNKALIYYLSGEEISENYFPYYIKIPYEERHSWLQSHYQFDCKCLACELRYPLLDCLPSSVSNSTVCCTNCHSKVKLPSKTCSECNHPIDSEKIDQQVSNIMTQISNVKNELLLGSSDVRQTYHKFLDCYRSLCQILAVPNKILVDLFDFHTSLVRCVYR